MNALIPLVKAQEDLVTLGYARVT